MCSILFWYVINNFCLWFSTIMIYTGGPTRTCIKTLLFHMDEVGFCRMNRWLFAWSCYETTKKIMVSFCLRFLMEEFEGLVDQCFNCPLFCLHLIFFFFGFSLVIDSVVILMENLRYACCCHVTLFCIWFLRLQLDWKVRQKCRFLISVWIYVEEEYVKNGLPPVVIVTSISSPWNPAL